jgi:hypothetical protein
MELREFGKSVSLLPPLLLTDPGLQEDLGHTV